MRRWWSQRLQHSVAPSTPTRWPAQLKGTVSPAKKALAHAFFLHQLNPLTACRRRLSPLPAAAEAALFFKKLSTVKVKAAAQRLWHSAGFTPLRGTPQKSLGAESLAGALAANRAYRQANRPPPIGSPAPMFHTVTHEPNSPKFDIS